MENNAADREQSTLSLVVSLPANFWFANLMEILERLAYFGVRAIAPLYLIAQSHENGLGLSYTQKGTIYAWWALIQCLVPMVSGGYTERYGYRKTLAVAFLINIVGYLTMAQSKPITDMLAAHGYAGMGYWVFLTAACLVALGTAIFKPPCHGTIAKTTDEKTSSMGWGLFYWVVNIGGALAPMLAAELRGEIDWQYVFYAAAIITLLNFLPLFILYREPAKTPPAEGEQPKGAIDVFFHSIFTILKDFRMVVFLLIFSCFWLMFMQLFDLLPNFIDEWVDSSDVARIAGWISDGWVLANGQTKPEILINIDAISIIILVLFISWLIRKMNKVVAMVIGMLISLVGFVGAGYTQLGWICALMIFVFAIGEMTCSPTFSAYIGLIAPKDKKALYMGYSNIPFAIGWALGNLIGGYFYDNYGAKDTLALKYLATDTKLVARAAQAADWSDALDKLPKLLKIERDQAFEAACETRGVEPEQMAAELREAFRYDAGTIRNLALLHLALRPENRAESVAGFAQVVRELSGTLTGDAARFAGEVRKAVIPPKPDGAVEAADPPPATRPAFAPAPDAKLPAAGRVLEDADEIRRLVGLARKLTRGELTLEEVHLPTIVRYLPTITGVKRDEALATVRELENEDRPADRRLTDSQIIAMLWRQFGDDPDVLDDLALAWFAAGTDRVYQALADTPFQYGEKQVERRMDEISRRIGISRGEAFAGLSVALGYDPRKVDSALADVHPATTQPHADLYVYLATQPDPRYHAVNDMDWKHNLDLLREMVRSDPRSLKVVKKEIDKVGIIERIVKFILRLLGKEEPAGVMTPEGVNYTKLAAKRPLIQKALAAKDWAKTPEQARRLMRMDPYRARLLAMGDKTHARKVLWDKYDPFMVWVYLGALGLAGTLGMIVFYFATKGSQPGGENGDDANAADDRNTAGDNPNTTAGDNSNTASADNGSNAAGDEPQAQPEPA